MPCVLVSENPGALSVLQVPCKKEQLEALNLLCWVSHTGFIGDIMPRLVD
jgi:hypothetical protein